MSEDAAAYRVLARKYRPASFAGLIGQDALVRTLSNAIAMDPLGPRLSADGRARGGQDLDRADHRPRPQLHRRGWDRRPDARSRAGRAITAFLSPRIATST